jgi:hypothetical protein
MQSMVFTKYFHEGIAFLLSLNFLFLGVKKGFLVWVQYYNQNFDNFMKHTYKKMWNYIFNSEHKMM